MKTEHERYIVDDNGSRTAVILPVERYEHLLEDLHDLAVVAERRDEKTIDMEERTRRLREDGTL